ncbi:unnamed protein product [Mycena citricolor]|uniref:SUI1 domain-containing protein n=1 Tax=Mycena citricolor TaxID=2018698 RepID=A0AAD2H7S3_9AGAR|nr:unnamed protein product [Mycena citricolor]
MFKKPLGTLKTSAPLRSSDRRKLKQRVVAAHGLSPEDGDDLVPEGILSLKFHTHLDVPGTVYISPHGDPLWFTVGKGSDELIPSIYTLWKRPQGLLPFLSTPEAVIPALVGGADLMIPVVHISKSLQEGQLVTIRRYVGGKTGSLSAPLAVGKMALSGDAIRDGQQAKGKAVHIIHTWKDHLWDMGSKPDRGPEEIPLSLAQDSESEGTSRADDSVAQNSPSDALPDPAPAQEASSVADDALPAYSASDISTLLQTAAVQAVAMILCNVPASSFPISGSIFYSSYVLPSRPAFPSSILPSPNESPNPLDITIKNSIHKSMTSFLKSLEKISLVTLKAPPKHGQQTEVSVTGVNTKHPLVAGHKPFVSVKAIEETAAKKALRQERLKEAEQKSEHWVEVKELLKPHLKSVELFNALGGRYRGSNYDSRVLLMSIPSAETLYSVTEVRAKVNEYITSNGLVNPRDQAYINVDPVLSHVIAPKKGKGEASIAAVEFLKRDDLMRQVVEQMQPWHEITAPGKEPVGALKPIQVVMKMRQGRKAATLISGFEPFLILVAEDMAEDLRKLCAGATSVSQRTGGIQGLEVLVQGKQSKIVTDYLTEKGIRKEWIQVSNLLGKK